MKSNLHKLFFFLIAIFYGSLTDQRPAGRHSIKALLAEAFPGVYSDAESDVVALELERTFWEKATILHAEFHRPEAKPAPLRIARHYAETYDLALDPARVVVTTGSSGGFILAFLSLFEAGDRVALADEFFIVEERGDLTAVIDLLDFALELVLGDDVIPVRSARCHGDLATREVSEAFDGISFVEHQHLR